MLYLIPPFDYIEFCYKEELFQIFLNFLKKYGTVKTLMKN